MWRWIYLFSTNISAFDLLQCDNISVMSLNLLNRIFNSNRRRIRRLVIPDLAKLHIKLE